MALVDSAAPEDEAFDPLLAGYYCTLPRNFDEMVDRDGRVRAHWRPFLRMLAALGPDEVNRLFAAADRHLRDSGVFYRVYEDPAGVDPALAAQPCAAADRGRRMADAQGRADPARRAPGSDPRRSLRPRRSGARRPPAGGGGGRQSGIPAADGRRGAAGRRASARLRRRCRPLAGRALVGLERPRAGALGRRLCAGEPAGAVARHARHLSRAARRAGGAVLPGLPDGIVLAQPARRFPRLPADAGAAERDLFRARLSRALSRLPAGRGRRPHRPP